MGSVQNPIIPAELLEQHRTNTFNWDPRSSLDSVSAAVSFVEQRGFIFFWPIRGVQFPSLWSAVAGNRDVASAHDDPGHVTWGWKDELLDQRKWYYAKILRGKATFISFEMAPHFYALSRNYGDPEGDMNQLYHDGALSQAAKRIFDKILSDGPLDTVTLRRKIQMTGRASKSPFERALVELQRDFKILPTGIAKTGGWRYSFIYELVHRYYPDLVRAARGIKEQQARTALARSALDALGAASRAELQRPFGWTKVGLERTLQDLSSEDYVHLNANLEGSPEKLVILCSLAQS